MDNSMIIDGIDIKQLSDDELASRLQDYGFSLGPIVDSTRIVYQRKLARLIRGEDLHMSEHEEEDDDLGDKSSGEECNISKSVLGLNSPAAFRYEELKRRPLPRAQGESWETLHLVDNIVTQAQPLPEDSTDGSKSFLVKTVVFALVIFIIFLVYQNMESGVHNPIPSPD